MLDLHKRYGPVVRIAPNELALAYEGVWDDVLGGTYDNELPRWKPFYRVQPNQKQMIFTAPPDEHSKMRRALSYGFSDRGIREMESRMGRMLSKMLCRLADVCDQDRTKPTANKHSEATSGVVDLTKWCNFMTFDMIGELAFGESFECLEKLTYHPWVEPIVTLTHFSGIIGLLGFYPKFQDLLLNVFGGVICRRMDFHQKHSRAAIERRAMKPDRKDLLTEPLKQTQKQAEVSLSVLISSFGTTHMQKGLD
jgi:cytochrome P450